MKVSDKAIVKVTVANCSLDTAWWKWTTHEGLLTFFGSDNKIELTEGGCFEIYFLMDNPAGFRGSEGCKILAYTPKEMFSFTWNAPPEFKEVRESSYFTAVIVNFRTVTVKQTEILLRHIGWPEDKKWNPVFKYFDNAWDTVLKKFEQSVLNDMKI
jgi:uncharacterized protein YndB with AHSA1/START domain